MAVLPKVTLVVRNKTAAQWEQFTGILEQGQLGVENDTNKMKIGNGEDLYKDLPYLYLTPAEVLKLNEDLEERLGESIQVTSVVVNGEKMTGDVGLGQLAVKDRISWEELNEQLRTKFEDLSSPLQVYGSYLEFPTVGKEEYVYLDESSGTTYRWKNMKYYVVGTDYSKIEIINGGDSTNGKS